MQSYLQYRRIRQEVQEDLILAQQLAKRPVGSTTSSSSPEPDNYSDKERGVTVPDGPASSLDAHFVPGVTIKPPEDNNGKTVFVVGWKEHDPTNPYEWSMARKWLTTMTCCIIAIALTIPSSIDGATQEAFNIDHRINDMAGSMITGIFLIGVGVGSLFSGPFSETFGRNIIYFIAITLVMLFIMAKALAPNFGGALAFRFLCALFAATPMTVAGGTVGDIWTPMQITFGLPLMTICAYAGPIVGPVIGAYTPLIGYEWADWISMIFTGATLVVVILGQPETYGPLLLEWRAKHMRDLTGDDRYQAEHASASSLGSRLLVNVYRPFVMIWTEPIILVFSFYLILLYFILFTFLNGYPYIFAKVYGISVSMTFIIFVAMLPGVFVALVLVPFMYRLTKKAAAKAAAEGKALQPEVSLYWAMAGASILMPISLFWMAWTCYPSISIWSPIVASGIFGYALVCIFTTSYMYIIFVYLQYAASALGFMTFSRYVVAGALSPASVKMYENIGPHWSLTIVAIIATIMAPVPFMLYKYGHKIRAMSKNAVNKA
ncbi:major facilitator superfamily domain-containing protein [Aspergillus alliaceus]|uniref:Major facilitator superfamily domain-containing protein n=1 Tax=Petromyces alliaceus TaxID=209559 RepID=A0A5N6G2T8_PETAA|nr:major facilitator superfamily domain-containing protein [Aspergillus alliaceus]KAB8236582.1 major facilitator superfamily domain-containing protein [Aspergillus alliaceus]KAE8395583.1 major facilitator superfamily domain-containing protein [Aspergillus alliaceus]